MGMGWVVMGFITLQQSEAELVQGPWGCRIPMYFWDLLLQNCIFYVGVDVQ